MKKTMSFVLLACALSVHATVYLYEKFDSYGPATLLSDPSTGWFVNPAQDSITAPTIELVKPEYGFSESVTHVATIAERKGVAVVNKSRMDAIKLINNGANVVGPRTMYAAVRLQIVSSGTGALSTSWFVGFGDSTFTRVCGKVYIQATPSPNTDFKFSVTKNTDGAAVSDPTLHKYGSVYLLVLKYKYMSDVAPLVGTAQKNDSVMLFVNPDLSVAESPIPTIRATMGTGNDFAATHKLTFALNQKGPGLRIGSVTVTDNWGELNSLINSIGVASNVARNISYSAERVITYAEGQLGIYSLQGVRLLNKMSTGSVDVSLPKGVYVAKFKSVSGQVSSAKIVVSK
jgi:hypothetical protein